MDWINYTYCRMDAATEMLGSENEFESDTEDILNAHPKKLERLTHF